ncbi:MAG TPA: pyridoxamine 5'-phosphate oxidase family protein [Candidatus Binatia bacterium]|nr:pyridoxamine 5'-phosphate oxidase family protein [Candidatus Binatia bacterium]
MPRERIAMTPAEVTAFLARKRIAVVGTIGADGAPDGEPATLLVDGGDVGVVVPRDGATWRNVARDPRVVVSLEEFPSYAGIKGVTIHGTAVRLADDATGGVRFRIEAPRFESFDFSKMKRPPGGGGAA